MSTQWIRPTAVALTTALVVAWPWEVFQQIPIFGLTVFKLCSAALIALALLDCALARTWKIPRTGIEAPLAALMLAGLLSIIFSADRGAGVSLMMRYASYVVMFYAVAWSVRSVDDAVVLARGFLLSTTVVAVLAILASLGVLAPVIAEFARQVGRRVAWDTEAGSLVRIAATSPDFNQGVLTFLLALPVALWLTRSESESRIEPALRWSLAVLLIGGMAVAFSRSAVAISAVLLCLYAAYQGLRGNVSARAVAVFAIVAIGLAVIAAPYVYSFAGRIGRGLEGNEASIAHRAYVYRIGFDLLPEYWLRGTGINASDTVIEAIADPDKSGGQTLHSVPFKFLLETGILGLVAYLWLWLQSIWILWRRHGREYGHKDFMWAMAGSGFALFAMLCVQPFMMLSIYPVLMGIALGARDREAAPIEALVWPRAIAVAAALVVVLPNYIGYQWHARQTAQFANRMETGVAHESRGEWRDAIGAYTAAAGGAPAKSRYFPFAADVTGLEQLYATVATQRYALHPKAGAFFALSRSHASAGEFTAAIAAAEDAIAEQSDYAPAYALLGEFHWRRRAFREALEAYGHAARIEDTLQIDSEAYTCDEWVGLAEQSRKRGDWTGAQSAIAKALDLDPDCPEALYLRGIEAELAGEAEEAKTLYESCLEYAPKHAGAQEGLAALAE